MTDLSSRVPKATQTPACLVCGSNEPGIVVGTRGRFGMAVTNVVCPRCSLCYQSPRPSEEAMAAYYGGAYREHYGSVGHQSDTGGTHLPGTSEFDASVEAWHQNQASNSVHMGELRLGQRVLEVGCRSARTLCLLRDSVGIVPFGVEPGSEQAEEARALGVDCFTGLIEDLPAPPHKFDQIQMFHVLEHIHDPLAALLRLRDWLVPGGRLLIEVPNVLQPYGSLEGNFFQNAHLTNFSYVTLEALLTRAGFVTKKRVDETALLVLATVSAHASSELPLPFTAQRLEHEPAWIVDCLATYGALEEIRRVIRTNGIGMEALEALIEVVGRPAFVPHLIDVVSEVAEGLVEHEAPRAAAALVDAAARGPHPAEITEGLRGFAVKLMKLSGQTDGQRVSATG